MVRFSVVVLFLTACGASQRPEDSFPVEERKLLDSSYFSCNPPNGGGLNNELAYMQTLDAVVKEKGGEIVHVRRTEVGTVDPAPMAEIEAGYTYNINFVTGAGGGAPVAIDTMWTSDEPRNFESALNAERNSVAIAVPPEAKGRFYSVRITLKPSEGPVCFEEMVTRFPVKPAAQ